MFDPAGIMTTKDGKPGSANGKRYRLVGSDLVRRFEDQFHVWDFAGLDITRRINATLLRLPLRTQQSEDGVWQVLTLRQ